MIKILTDNDNYKKYEEVVDNVGDVLEDWDYIITSDNYELDENAIDRIASILESYGNKYYKTEYGTTFIVVYHG